jgi:hypothetical protein
MGPLGNINHHRFQEYIWIPVTPDDVDNGSSGDLRKVSYSPASLCLQDLKVIAVATVMPFLS